MRQRRELEQWIDIFEADLAAAMLRANAVSESVLNRPTPESGDTSDDELAEYDSVVARREDAVRRVEVLREKLMGLRTQLSQCVPAK